MIKLLLPSAAAVVFMMCAAAAEAQSYSGYYWGTVSIVRTKPATCPANTPTAALGFNVTQSGKAITATYGGGITLRGKVFKKGFKARGKRDSATTDTVRLTKIKPTSALVNQKIVWSGTGSRCIYLYRGTLSRS